MPKEPNWWPGIQKQEPFQRGVVLDNPRNLLPRKGKEEVPPEQMALPIDVEHLKPQLCPECHGRGVEKKGRKCRVCRGEGVIPADPKSSPREAHEGECQGKALPDVGNRDQTG